MASPQHDIDTKRTLLSDAPDIDFNPRMMLLSMNKSFATVLKDKLHRHWIHNSMGSILFAMATIAFLAYGGWRLWHHGLYDISGGVIILIGIPVAGFSLASAFQLVRFLKQLANGQSFPELQNDVSKTLGPWDRRTAFSLGLSDRISKVLLTLYIGLFTFFLVVVVMDAFWFFLFFATVIMIILSKFLYELCRHLYFGRSRIHFSAFPLLLGDNLHLQWECPASIDSLDQIEATLRYVEQEIVMEKRGSGKSTPVTKNYQVYSDRYIQKKENFMREVTPRVSLSFDLSSPALRDHETSLVEKIKTYWFLEIIVHKKGWDFRDTYLLPLWKSAVPSTQDEKKTI